MTNRTNRTKTTAQTKTADLTDLTNRTDRTNLTDPPVLRLEPERRLCPAFDPVSIALFPVASRGEMGLRVVDNICEEHIM